MLKIAGLGVIALLLFTVQLKVYRKMWERNLYVSLAFVQSSLFEGEEGALLEVIENRKLLPLSMLKVKFQTSRNLEFAGTEGSKVTDQYYRNDIFQIGGGERITRTLTFTGKKRGYYKINGIDLVSSDLFMITELTDSRETDRYVYIYPRPYDSPEFRLSLQQQSGEILTRRHLLEDPFEYRGIREYQPYDDMRSINWKATARTEELKVNQRNYTALQTIRVFFNIEDTGILKKEEAVEASLRITAGLAEFFLGQGIQVACFGNGLDIHTGKPVQIEASAGSGQMEHIYKVLARVDTAAGTASFTEVFAQRLLQEAGGTVTFLVAPNCYQDFQALMEEYRLGGHDFVWFCPVWDKEEPEAAVTLQPFKKVIHLRN